MIEIRADPDLVQTVDKVYQRTTIGAVSKANFCCKMIGAPFNRSAHRISEYHFPGYAKIINIHVTYICMFFSTTKLPLF